MVKKYKITLWFHVKCRENWWYQQNLTRKFVLIKFDPSNIKVRWKLIGSPRPEYWSEMKWAITRKDGKGGVWWLRTIIRKDAESSPRNVIIRTDILKRKQTLRLAAQAYRAATGKLWCSEVKHKTKGRLSRKWRKMNYKMFQKLVSSENLLELEVYECLLAKFRVIFVGSKVTIDRNRFFDMVDNSRIEIFQ